MTRVICFLCAKIYYHNLLLADYLIGFLRGHVYVGQGYYWKVPGLSLNNTSHYVVNMSETVGNQDGGCFFAAMAGTAIYQDVVRRI